MANLKEYLKTRTLSWWLSSSLFGFIIVLIAFPTLRLQVTAWVQRQFLNDPEIEYRSEYPYFTDEVYQFTYYDLNKQKHEFRDHHGEVIFINLWGTWCGHCVAEMPSIEELYDDYGDKVVFLMYSDQDSPQILKTFKENGNYDLPFAYRDPNTTYDFRAKGYPTTYIISKKGEIIHKESGAKDWNSDGVRKRLNELLKE